MSSIHGSYEDVDNSISACLGSYDHSIKMFDQRIQKSVLTVDHGHPVESVVMFPTGTLLVAAGL